MKSLLPQLQKAKQAALIVNHLSHHKRKAILRKVVRLLRSHKKEILAANARDLVGFDENNPLRDRLLLTPARIEGMAVEVEGLIHLPDPVGQKFDHRVRQGMKMYRQRVPLGVIGVVYESRPNVTTDTAAICLKSGNAVLLKGGREAKHSYKVLLRLIQQALKKEGVNINAVQMLDPENRDLVRQLITANKYVDLVVPRGSQKFIDFIRAQATVPTIETGAGVCHTFVDKTADFKKSAKVIGNGKTQRPSTCNALDTVLVHRDIASKFLPIMAAELVKKKVEIFADQVSYIILKKHYPLHLLKRARPSDFGREFLSQKILVVAVAGVDEAIAFINKHSSRHTESILSGSRTNQKRFSALVDAAVIHINNSTRLTDGAVFGQGSEIGTSTQKLHARGPMGPSEMTTYKWIAQGNYATRPD